MNKTKKRLLYIVYVAVVAIVIFLFTTYSSNLKKDAHEPLATGLERLGVTLNELPSYRKGVTSDETFLYFLDENSPAANFSVTPFSFADEREHVRGMFDRNISETPIVVDSVRGLQISGTLRENEHRKWYGVASNNDSMQVVIIPLSSGTLRIMNIRHGDRFNEVISAVRVDKNPTHPYEWKYATYSNDAFGFRLRYPINDRYYGPLRMEEHYNRDGQLSLTWMAWRADPVFVLRVIASPYKKAEFSKKMENGDYTYRTVNGKEYLEMRFYGYDDGGGNAIYIPHNDYWLEVMTEAYGTATAGEYGRRASEKILESIEFTRESR